MVAGKLAGAIVNVTGPSYNAQDGVPVVEFVIVFDTLASTHDLMKSSLGTVLSSFMQFLNAFYEDF